MANKSRFPVTLFFLIFTASSYSQQGIENENFELNNVVIQLEGKEFVRTDKGTCPALTVISVIRQGKPVYRKDICSTQLSDVEIIVTGYITVVESYSSAVRWSEFYVFDLCKMRLFITKKLPDSESGLTWQKFIDMTDTFKTKYVAKSILLE